MNIKHKDNNLAIIFILTIAGSLYFYQLGTESFWTDEFYSVYDAQGIPETLPLTRPFYYLLLRLWMVFGDSDVWLRSLSIPFALGTVFCTYRLGKSLVSQSVGLISAILITFSPIFINHAQEVRMYTLSTFLSVVGTLALIDFLERMTIKSLGIWIVMRIIATLTTQTNVFLLIPDCILLLWQLRRRHRILLSLAGFLVVLSLISLPWTINIYHSALDFGQGWAANDDKPTLVNILSRLTIFTAYWPLKSLNSSVLEHFYKLYTIMLVGVLAGCLLPQAMILGKKETGDFRSRRGEEREKNPCSSSQVIPQLWNVRINGQKHLVWLGMWVFIPATIMLFLSWVLVPIWVPRYLLFIAPYLLILLAVGVNKICHWQPKLAILLVVMYVVAVSIGLHDYYYKTYRPDWRGAAIAIAEQEQPGDVIALYLNKDRSFKEMIGRYYSGTVPMYLLDIDQVTGEATLPTFPSRLWLVHNDNRGISDSFLDKIKSQYQVEQHQVFKNEIGWEVVINLFLLNKN